MPTPSERDAGGFGRSRKPCPRDSRGLSCEIRARQPCLKRRGHTIDGSVSGVREDWLPSVAVTRNEGQRFRRVQAIAASLDFADENWQQNVQKVSARPKSGCLTTTSARGHISARRHLGPGSPIPCQHGTTAGPPCGGRGRAAAGGRRDVAASCASSCRPNSGPNPAEFALIGVVVHPRTVRCRAA